MRFILFFLTIVFLAACSPDAAQTQDVVFEKSTVRILRQTGEETEISAEIADTVKKRELGLMYRSFLPENNGMLFVFPSVRKISMWMANTSISLDMIFIDANAKIIRIVNDTAPFSHDEIRSGKPAKAVLEMNAGSAKRLNIQEGDHIENQFF